MDDEQLLRYSRQILLPQVGAEGQERLRDSHALIIGLGGLGSPVAMYLAAAGVGRLTLVDFDCVELSNLQRQIAHRTCDIGRPKVASARDGLLALNPLIEVATVDRRLEGAELLARVAEADVVVDASDNFATRFALNEACVQAAVPLVSGAAIRMEGQVAVFRPDRPESPCYRCLYRDEAELPETCTQTGVFTPLVGIVGSVQATEAMKVLLELGETVTGRLLLLDALTMEWRSIRLRKDPHCPVCTAPRAAAG
jgi:molybdopterin-synthase adenylyltransferase